MPLLPYIQGNPSPYLFKCGHLNRWENNMQKQRLNDEF